MYKFYFLVLLIYLFSCNQSKVVNEPDISNGYDNGLRLKGSGIYQEYCFTCHNMNPTDSGVLSMYEVSDVVPNNYRDFRKIRHIINITGDEENIAFPLFYYLKVIGVPKYR